MTLTDQLGKVFRKHLGIHMDVATWRQLSKAIKDHLIISPKEHPDFEPVFDDQAGHGVSVAAIHYGRTREEIVDMPDLNYWRFQAASVLWHICLHVTRASGTQFGHVYTVSDAQGVLRLHAGTYKEPEALEQVISENVPPPGSNQVCESPAGQQFLTSAATCANPSHCGGASAHALPIKARGMVLTPQIIMLLCKLHPPPEGSQTIPSFKSVAQSNAISMVLASYSPLLIVLPTGGGKSDCFLLPALLPNAKVQLVITPYVALSDEIERRCERHEIIVHNWDKREPGSTVGVVAPPIVKGILVVTAEGALTKTFQSLIQQMIEMRLIDRVFLDEAHVPVIAHDFRQSLGSTRGLYTLLGKVQTVLLSATVPPERESEFELFYHLPHLRIVRDETTRPNLHYAVNLDASNQQDTIRVFLAYYKQWKQTNNSPDDRILVYCVTKALAEEVSRQLDCGCCHSGFSKRSRDQVLKDFYSPTGKKIVCGTSCIGTGLDPPNVRLVVHLGGCYTMTEYAQESGRAGRDGLPSTCILFASAMSLGSVCTLEKAKLFEYIYSNHCRRQVLSGWLDGYSYNCFSRECEKCDVCLDLYDSMQKAQLPAPASTLPPPDRAAISEQQEQEASPRQELGPQTTSGVVEGALAVGGEGCSESHHEGFTTTVRTFAIPSFRTRKRPLPSGFDGGDEVAGSRRLRASELRVVNETALYEFGAWLDEHKKYCVICICRNHTYREHNKPEARHVTNCGSFRTARQYIHINSQNVVCFTCGAPKILCGSKNEVHTRDLCRYGDVIFALAFHAFKDNELPGRVAQSTTLVPPDDFSDQQWAEWASGVNVAFGSTSVTNGFHYAFWVYHTLIL